MKKFLHHNWQWVIGAAITVGLPASYYLYAREFPTRSEFIAHCVQQEKDQIRNDDMLREIRDDVKQVKQVLMKAP